VERKRDSRKSQKDVEEEKRWDLGTDFSADPQQKQQEDDAVSKTPPCFLARIVEIGNEAVVYIYPQD
jgi:hypothetical protein